MKRISYISRAFGLLMFTMVMLTSVFGKQLPQKHHEPTKSKQEKSTKKQQPTNQSFVSELSLEVVVPSHAFNFGENPFVLPTPQVIYLIIESSAKSLYKTTFPSFIFWKSLRAFYCSQCPIILSLWKDKNLLYLYSNFQNHEILWFYV